MVWNTRSAGVWRRTFQSLNNVTLLITSCEFMPWSAKILEGFCQGWEDSNLICPEKEVCLMLLISAVLIPPAVRVWCSERGRRSLLPTLPAAGTESWATFRLPLHWSNLSSMFAPLVTWVDRSSTWVWCLFLTWFPPVGGILMDSLELAFLLSPSFVEMNLVLRGPKLVVAELLDYFFFVTPHGQDIFHCEWRQITVVWKTGWWVCNSHCTEGIKYRII